MKISEEIQKARDKILSTNWEGPMTHNCIGFILRDLAEKTDNKYANQLIEEFDLTEHFNIYSVEEK